MTAGKGGEELYKQKQALSVSYAIDSYCRRSSSTRLFCCKAGQVGNVSGEETAFDIHQTGMGDTIEIGAEPLTVRLVFGV
jgi:hypothetical protein